MFYVEQVAKEKNNFVESEKTLNEVFNMLCFGDIEKCALTLLVNIMITLYPNENMKNNLSTNIFRWVS